MEWKITIEERTKHDASFNSLGAVNGLLTGEKAREFFLKSNLATPILGQIWGLADLNKDGKLDKKEFSIACCLIKRVLTSGATVLPSSLPSSLLIEPAQNPTVASPPVQQHSTSNSPLFNASFPPIQAASSPVLFAGVSMSNLTSNGTAIGAQNARIMPTAPSQSNLVSSAGISMSMSSLNPGAIPTSFTQAGM